jgi:hypothetical protein
MIEPADLLHGREDDPATLVISDYNTSIYGSNDFPTQRWIVLEPDNVASSFRILNAPRAQNRAAHSVENTHKGTALQTALRSVNGLRLGTLSLFALLDPSRGFLASTAI